MDEFQGSPAEHSLYVLETIADVDALVDAEAQLYSCFLASERADHPPHLPVPREAFEDWASKRNHGHEARRRRFLRRLPVHEEALRFRAYLMATNDEEASECLGIPRSVFRAWRISRGHPSRHHERPAPVPLPSTAGPVHGGEIA